MLSLCLRCSGMKSSNRRIGCWWKWWWLTLDLCWEVHHLLDCADVGVFGRLRWVILWSLPGSSVQQFVEQALWWRSISISSSLGSYLNHKLYQAPNIQENSSKTRGCYRRKQKHALPWSSCYDRLYLCRGLDGLGARLVDQSMCQTLMSRSDIAWICVTLHPW